MIFKDKKKTQNIFQLALYVLAIVGLLFVGVFIAMQFNLLNVRGSASQRNSYFNLQNKLKPNNTDNGNLKVICKINILSKYAPLTSVNIYRAIEQGGEDVLIEKMINIASVRFQNNPAFVKSMSDCDNSNDNNQTINLPTTAFAWADSEEWNLMKEVFSRDQEIINKAAKDAGISPRFIISGVMGEQFRFFTNRRESFKGYFEPLKILASLSKFSFGIAGLKPETVSLIENHLKDPNSIFYLGPNLEHVADYPPNITDVASERMNRITDTKNPYYSYLYVGLFMRQVEAQWKNAGYDISNHPEIVSTLYNLGFNRSIPKANAQAGGSPITVNGVTYTFGDIGYEFYYSGELANIFPLVQKE